MKRREIDRKAVARVLRFVAFGCMVLAEKLDPINPKKASYAQR